MSWNTPKIDWQPTDKFNASEYNRIAGNLHYLRDYARDKWYNVNYEIAEISFSTLSLASIINALEDSLDNLNKNTYNYASIGSKKTYVGNRRPINYSELNRIESTTLKIYTTLNAEQTKVLNFTLGQMQFPTICKGV